MAKNMKVPNELIERLEFLENELKIEINISAFYDDKFYTGEQCILIKGEIIGEVIEKDILIIASSYNQEGEITGTVFETIISAKNFDGIVTFENYLLIAPNEKVSKIRVYPTYHAKF